MFLEYFRVFLADYIQIILYFLLKSSDQALLIGNFHVKIFVDRQVNEQSFVEEIIRSLDFIIIHGSFVLDVLVAASFSEVLHKGDLWSLHLPLQSEVSLTILPPGSPSPCPLLEGLHRSRELCSPKAQWSVVPTREFCAGREYVGHLDTGQSDQQGDLEVEMD